MFDVCIFGGGPSGLALALRLAQLGRSAVVVEKASFPRSRLGESLTSGVIPLLKVIEVWSELEAAGFFNASPSKVLWAGQLNSQLGRAAFTVDRGVFDSVLLGAARAAGVSVKIPARARAIDRAEDWSITLDSGEVIRARFIADASSRARILGGKKNILGRRTMAIYAYWSNADPEERETLVEAGVSEWFWAAAIPDGRVNAMVFVDRESASRERYSNLIQRSRFLPGRLAEASCGEVHLCDATPFLDEAPVSARSIKVGDAALSLDPLSSQGVQTALGTALHAAVVINTILDRPEHAELAADFYRLRIAASAKFHARAASQWYREQAQYMPTRFWQTRASADPPEEPPRGHRLASLDQSVQLSPRVQFVPIATAAERYVVEATGVALGDEIYAQVGDLRIAALLEGARRPIAARDLARRWNVQFSTPYALELLEWVWNRALIEAVN